MMAALKTCKRFSIHFRPQAPLHLAIGFEGFYPHSLDTLLFIQLTLHGGRKRPVRVRSLETFSLELASDLFHEL